MKDSNYYERLRNQFRPDKVRVLFLGESRPDDGSFFYLANSNLFKHTREAFRIAIGSAIPDGNEFLHYFKSNGFYLEDLCREPVNTLEEGARFKARNNAISFLATKLDEMRPRLVIVVMKAIIPEVIVSIQRSELHDLPVKAFPFPVRWRRNIDSFVVGLSDTIKREPLFR